MTAWSFVVLARSTLQNFRPSRRPSPGPEQFLRTARSRLHSLCVDFLGCSLLPWSCFWAAAESQGNRYAFNLPSCACGFGVISCA